MDKIYLDGTLMIDLTQRCNLKCAHCFRGEPRDVDMSHEVINAFLDQLRGVAHITLSGGEPMLAPDMISYITDEIIKRGIVLQSYGMVTNGTIQSETIANALNRMNEYTNSLAEKFNSPEAKDKCVSMAISNDEYHLQAGVTQEQINATAAFYKGHCSKGITIQARRYEENNVIVGTGRATCSGDKPSYTIIPPHRIDMEPETRILKADVLTLTQTGVIFADGYITNDYEQNPLTPSCMQYPDGWTMGSRGALEHQAPQQA